MSLTSFLNNKDVREAFRHEFSIPRLGVKKELVAPPLSKRYTLVGTAFDYILRFYLERLNPNVITRKWVAENALSSPLSPILTDVEIDAETGAVSYSETETTLKVTHLIENAKLHCSNFLLSGSFTNELFESAIHLAQLDVITRAGIIDENLGVAHREDIEDLHNLAININPDLFQTSEICFLNPTFGDGSRLVGGADADLLIDDTLIDVKTTMKLQLKRDHINQLLGYYILHGVSGIGEHSQKLQITKIGIYFSRFAYLHILDLYQIINQETFPSFVDWFLERAKQK